MSNDDEATPAQQEAPDEEGKENELDGHATNYSSLRHEKIFVDDSNRSANHVLTDNMASDDAADSITTRSTPVEASSKGGEDTEAIEIEKGEENLEADENETSNVCR